MSNVERVTRRGLLVGLAGAGATAGMGIEAAVAADPPVAFMQKVSHELLTSTRSRSPELIASVIHRYADVGYIGNYSLGSYRGQLAPADRQTYINGMVRFIGRYAAKEAPKYPVARTQIFVQPCRAARD